MSQKRTYYNKYGLRPSTTITAEGLEDKVSPSNTLQPENGSAHGICWQYNTVEQEQNNAITTCIYGWWKAAWL